MIHTPIAIFVYNRPDHARHLFDSLLKCARLEECDVHVFCDGVKKTEDQLGVDAARQTVDAFAPRLNAKVLKRKHNMGLARSIVAGVAELCEQFGRVIVVEDDLILHPFFLDFMLQALDRYAHDERVAQVAGYLPPIYPDLQTDSFFLPLTTSYGWGTWQRAWALFSSDASHALEMLEANKSLKHQFDLDNTYPYTNMLRATAEGTTDSWAILWYWCTFIDRKLTLYPSRSLVWVGGFDHLATHTKTDVIPRFYDQPLDLILKEKWHAPISFPDLPEIDGNSFRKLKKFLHRDSPHKWQVRVTRTFKRLLTRLVK